jgi:CheY-like chemotaxis protein
VTSVRSKGEQIVIIDRDQNHLPILCKYLSDLGYQLKAYPSYSEAVETLEQGSAQLLIMDNTELDDPASSVGTAISQLVETKLIPVLLLSSRAFIFDIEKYLKLGVERCLPKPVPLKELAILCRQILDSRNSDLALKIRDSAIAGVNQGIESQDKPPKDLLH